MAKQTLLRMAFTRGDVSFIYRGLTVLREQYKTALAHDASEAVNSALCMADIDSIQHRIVVSVAKAGGVNALAQTPPAVVDVVAEKHTKRMTHREAQKETAVATRKRNKAGAK